MAETTPKKSHTLRMVFIFVVIAVLVLWFFSSQFEGLPNGARPELPRVLTTISGEKIDASSLRGKPLVINFWATWCPPCLLETPNFVKVSNLFVGQVNFVGLAVDSGISEIRAFQSKFQIPYPLVRVPTQTLSAWRAEQLPMTYILDAEGAIVWSHRGYASEQELADAVEKALSEKPVQR